MRFTFDPARPPGQRVLAGSVTIGSEAAPLDLQQSYTLATKEYLAEGRDGYDCLEVRACVRACVRAFIVTVSGASCLRVRSLEHSGVFPAASRRAVP
jgi:5'-nucleotidase